MGTTGQTAAVDYRREQDEVLRLLTVTPIRLVHHAPVPRPALAGPRADLRPSKALLKLQRLFDRHAFWARGRGFAQLRRLLAGSDAVVSLWRGKRLVGFGRATSDGFSRAVLWDIVVAGDLQGHGLGRQVIEELLHTPPVVGVERVYLMTTKSAGFYQQLGQDANPQQLMVLRR